MSDERLPLIAALIFGVAYVFMTPPFAVPDEELHFWRAAAIAMGHVVPNGGGKPDSAHIPQGLKTLVWVMQTTKDFQLAYRIPLEPMKEPPVQFPAWYTPVPFLPQALVVEIGAMSLFLAAPGVGWLYAARVLQGCAIGAATSALSAALIDLQPPGSTRAPSTDPSSTPSMTGMDRPGSM